MPARALGDKVSGYVEELNTSALEVAAVCRQQYKDFRQMQRVIATVPDHDVREKLFDMVEAAAEKTDDVLETSEREHELGTYVRANKFAQADVIVMDNNAKRRKQEQKAKGA